MTSAQAAYEITAAAVPADATINLVANTPFPQTGSIDASAERTYTFTHRSGRATYLDIDVVRWLPPRAGDVCFAAVIGCLCSSDHQRHTHTPTQVGGDPLDTALWNPDGDEIEVSAGLLLLQECEVSGEYTLTVAGANVAYSLTLDTEDVADGTLLSNPARGTDELTVVWDPLPVNPGEADYEYEIWFVDGTPRDAPLARFWVCVCEKGGWGALG